MITGIVVMVLFMVAAGFGACWRMMATERLNGQVPYGTLVANMTASFGLGLLSDAGHMWAVVIGLGALGSLCAWSTVANEVARMARSGADTLAVLYLALSATTGVLSAWAGIQIANAIRATAA